MQIGIHPPQIGRKATLDAIRRAAIQAEELGWTAGCTAWNGSCA